MVVGYHKGAAVACPTSPSVRIRVRKRPQRGLRQRQAGASCSSSSGSPARTSSRPSTASRRSALSEGLHSAGDGHRPSCWIAPPPSAPRSRRRAHPVISVVLVILVVFVFLRSVRATPFPASPFRVSLIGTFGVMYLFGYSLDNLSLMALTISTGFVVDDAIVVIENITRHLEQGMRPMRGRPARARRKSALPCFHQHVADRRVHSAFCDGRHRGPSVPRVCRDLSVGHRSSLWSFRSPPRR